MFYVNGMLYVGSKLTLLDAKDGTSNTFLVGESNYGAYPWTVSGKLQGCGLIAGLSAAQDQINLHTGVGVHATTGFSSSHSRGANFAMADGSVQYVQDSIDKITYQSLGKRSDDLPVGGFSQ